MTSPSNPGPGAPTSAASSAGFCAACGAALSAGARFCHRCGTPLGQGLPVARGAAATGASPAASALPWGVAFLALLALVAAFAGKNFGAAKGSAIGGSSNSLPTTSIDGPAQGIAGGGAPGAGPAPDIASMSPSDRASRLYIRAMSAAEQGKADSASFFATMAVAAHEMIPEPTADERYHFGRAAELLGDAAIMRAQSDTILKERATSLLGLMLSARALRLQGNEDAARKVDALLLGALESELATGLIDYQQHRAEIDEAAAAARRAPQAPRTP